MVMQKSTIFLLEIPPEIFRSFQNADSPFLLNFAFSVSRILICEMSQRCEGGSSTAAPGGSSSTTQTTLQRPKPPSFSDEQYGYTGVLSLKAIHLQKTEPSDASSAAPPRPPRRSAGARPVRPVRRQNLQS